MRRDIETWVGRAAHVVLDLPPLVFVGVAVAVTGLTLWAHWRIVNRAGYPGCWSLMLLVPCVNVLFVLCFAFSRWPVQGKKGRA